MRSLRTRNREDAKRRFAQLSARYTLGILGIPSDDKDLTLSKLFDDYLPYCKAQRQPRTYRDTEMHIRLFLRPALGHIPAMRLSPAHVERLVGQMKDLHYNVRTINLRLETLRKILRRAVDNRQIPRLPTTIKLLPQPRPIPRYTSPEQVAVWLQSFPPCSELQRLRAELSFLTGITDKDIGRLQWKDHDATQNTIAFLRDKTGKPNIVPLIPRAAEILRIIKTQTRGPYIFGGVESSRRAFRTASRISGIRITPHMLRHSFATALLSSGVPIEIVSKLLGHGDIKTTQIYAQIIPEKLRTAIDNLEVLWQSVGSKKAGHD